MAKLEQGQNATKRAIANSIASDIENVVPKVKKVRTKLSDAEENLRENWSGSAADEAIRQTKKIENDISELTRLLKNISTDIKNAAKNTYRG